MNRPTLTVLNLKERMKTFLCPLPHQNSVSHFISITHERTCKDEDFESVAFSLLPSSGKPISREKYLKESAIFSGYQGFSHAKAAQLHPSSGKKCFLHLCSSNTLSSEIKIPPTHTHSTSKAITMCNIIDKSTFCSLYDKKFNSP